MKEVFYGVAMAFLGGLITYGFSVLDQRRRIRIKVEIASAHFRPSISDHYPCWVHFTVSLLCHNASPVKKAIWDLTLISAGERYPVMDTIPQRVEVLSIESTMGWQHRNHLIPFQEVYLEPKSELRLRRSWEIISKANDQQLQQGPFLLEYKTSSGHVFKKRIKVCFSHTPISNHVASA